MVAGTYPNTAGVVPALGLASVRGPVHASPVPDAPVSPPGRQPRSGFPLTPSLLALVVANLWPLAGVVLLGWTTFSVLLLFWLENVIVGLFNVGRLWMAGGPGPGGTAAKFFVVPFFIVHYGMFTAIHGLFVIAVFGGQQEDLAFSAATVARMALASGVVPAALALAASHGYSFVVNYLGSGEFRSATLQRLMFQPYTRVMILHVVIIFGGFLIVSLGQPTAALALLVVLKIALDGAAHVRERRRLQPAASPAAAQPIGPPRRESGRVPGRR